MKDFLQVVREGFSEEALLEPGPDRAGVKALRFVLTERARLTHEGQEKTTLRSIFWGDLRVEGCLASM